MSKDIKDLEKEVKKSKGKTKTALLNYYEIIMAIPEHPNYVEIRNILLNSLREVNYKLKHLTDRKFGEVFEKNLRAYDSQIYEKYKKMNVAPYIFANEYIIKRIERTYKRYENLFSESFMDIKDDILREIGECWFRS